MNRISTPYNLQTYQTRLANHSNSLETHKAELKEKLSFLIKEKVQTLNLNSEDNLTDAHYRDILDSLHNARTNDGGTFHRILHDAGIKTVSKYSWFSNQRATGKIEALKEYLGMENKEEEASRSFISCATEDLKSESDYPFTSKNFDLTHEYPSPIKNDLFYKLNSTDFKSVGNSNGGTFYRVLNDTHVGFIFDTPKNFTEISEKYEIPIEHHLIDPNRDLTKVKSVDIGVSSIERPTKKLEMHLFLSTNHSQGYFPNKTFHYYNQNEKYDSERLALSIIIANNSHKEKYLRQNGVLCYTMSRDVILIYNELSKGTLPKNINLNILKQQHVIVSTTRYCIIY